MLTVEISTEAQADLDLVFTFLADSYEAFGYPADESSERVLARTKEIRDRVLTTLVMKSERGTRHDDLLQGLRHVTIGKAVVYFTDQDDGGVVKILAFFLTGQDHQIRMLARLLG